MAVTHATKMLDVQHAYVNCTCMIHGWLDMPHVHGVFKPSIRSVRAWYSQMNSLLSIGALSPINIAVYKQPAKYIHVKLISIHVYST